MQSLGILIAVVVLATVFRKAWLPRVRPLFTKTLLITFIAVLCLVTALGLLWYWWSLPRDVFYGVRWEDITVEEDLAALERLNSLAASKVTSSGVMGMGGDTSPAPTKPDTTRPVTAPAVVPQAPLPVVLESFTGADVLPSVPFWKQTGIAPEVVIPSAPIVNAAANDRSIEVSIVGAGETLVLPAEYLRRTTDGQLLVALEPPRNFRAGKYTLQVRSAAEGEGLEESQLLYVQDFTWGVLAFNPDSDVYAPGETGILQVGVLDDEGVTLCDVNVEIRAIAPSGSVDRLSVANGKVRRNPDCRDKAVTDIPDYAANFLFAERGTYVFVISASTPNGQRSMTERVSVVGRALPDIRREAMTRIYPLAEYTMRIFFTPSHSFEGTVTEHVPLSFVLRNPQPAADIRPDDEETQSITWTQRWEAGRTYTLEYTYDAPDVSPEFYLLGPLSINGDIVQESTTVTNP